MSITTNELEDRINQLKKELIQTALTTGLSSPDTLCCSQKLDELITTYQKITINNKKRFDQKSYIEI